ncbi:ABC transporter substrate-binding protein [Parachitinimonas caeni]|uniref:Probable sugar-binding periplasmic protein n=1 Tax=Parachitinimonas caeni TaxID=3031301 RepID=A0ABT7DZ93_9NEIS|nr:ABC transporter substrate-binding protein [Parachitinimonas caeni]MDK2125366.1 ABC transporter substrate-binding protein [Parachitinimonas caeni]
MKQSRTPLHALIAGIGLLGATALAHAGEVEVLHYWTSGGEAKSAAELKKMMAAKGHTWKDFAVAGGGGENAMTVLKTRVVSGNPPTAAQIKGPSIQEWGNEGVLANLDPVAKAGGWDTLLPPVVANVMKYKGNYVAVPVNVHRVNWMWVNPEVFKKAGAKIPTTWDEFAAAADKIQKAGFIPVAHGGQNWQDATVFESIALGVGGADYYQKAFVKLDAAALASPTTEKVFDTLRLVKKYTDKDSPGRDWNLATAMVINGKAAMQFMGDWAKGEFTAAGKKPGTDFICAPAPGTAKAYTFNIDSFVLFSQKSKDMKVTNDLAASILSPEFQEVFNLNKGSIPARLNMPKTKFDDCARLSMDDFVATSKSGGLVPSFAHGMAMPSATQGAVVDVVSNFMNSSMSSKDAVQKLIAASKKR